MRISVLTFSAAATLLLAGNAAAADVSLPSAHDWSGFYVGLNAGAAWSSSHIESTILQASGAPRFDGDLDNSITDDGAVFTGGGLVGFNWQHEALLLGLEADINYVGFGGSANNSHTSFDTVWSTRLNWDANWFGTVRGRLGFAASNLLFYGTGGLAYGGIEADGEYGPSGNVWKSGSLDDVQWGWTIGAGAEYALTDNLSVGVEYLYVDLGSADFDYENVNGSSSSTQASAEADYQFSVARATLKLAF